MLIDGFIIMVIGMGTVFLFLTVMIFMMQTVSRFFKPLPGEFSAETAVLDNCEATPDEEIAVAIAAARAFDERKNS